MRFFSRFRWIPVLNLCVCVAHRQLEKKKKSTFSSRHMHRATRRRRRDAHTTRLLFAVKDERKHKIMQRKWFSLIFTFTVFFYFNDATHTHTWLWEKISRTQKKQRHHCMCYKKKQPNEGELAKKGHISILCFACHKNYPTQRN